MLMKAEQDKTKRALLRNQLKGIKQIEAISKFRETMTKKKKKIQQLYQLSVSNQIYIFPKTKIFTASSSSENDQQNLQEILSYDLKNQNKKNKNHQFSSQIMIRCNSLTSTEPDQYRSKNKFNIQFDKSKKDVSDCNITNYQSKSRKDKIQEKTATNSGKKLFFVPSNASNKGHKKKPSETIIVSFRGRQGEKSKIHTKTQFC